MMSKPQLEEFKDWLIREPERLKFIVSSVPFVAEVREVARCAAANRPSRVLGGDLARDAVVLCHCQTESVRTGKVVTVPAQRGRTA